MESLPACSRSLPSRPAFRSRPGSPFPWRRLLLNLLRAERRARAPDPQAAVAQAQVRMEARLGTGGSLPAETAAWLQNGGLGRGGGPDRRPGDPGGGEVHGAEHPRASAAARESFTHDAGDLEDRWAWGVTENGGACEAKVTVRPPASPCPAAAAPWRLQGLTAPGLELRRGRAHRGLPRPREAEVTVAGPGGGPSPQRRPALGVGDIGRASGWWRQRGTRREGRAASGGRALLSEAVPEAPTSGAFGPPGRGSPRAP